MIAIQFDNLIYPYQQQLDAWVNMRKPTGDAAKFSERWLHAGGSTTGTMTRLGEGILEEALEIGYETRQDVCLFLNRPDCQVTVADKTIAGAQYWLDLWGFDVPILPYRPMMADIGLMLSRDLRPAPLLHYITMRFERWELLRVFQTVKQQARAATEAQKPLGGFLLPQLTFPATC